MAEQGILTYGGIRNAPYGYQFIKSGTYTKKGVERQKLIINEYELKYVKKIFNLYINMGYGIGKIAKELNDNKIKPRRSNNWSTSSIGNILANPIYMGYPAYSKKTSQKMASRKKVPFEKWIFPKNQVKDLVIISEKDWYKAKDIRNSRIKNKENKNYKNPVVTKSTLLFIGMMQCGECGYAFTTSESKKKKKNGEIQKYKYYRCSSHRFTHNCNLEKKSIKQEVIEEFVLKYVYSFLDQIQRLDYSEIIEKNLVNKGENEQKELKKFKQKIIECEKNVSVLKQEVVKSIAGESEFSKELLNELIEEKNKEIEQLYKKKYEIEKIIEQKDIGKIDLIKFKEKIPIWKKEFEKGDIFYKKALLSKIIKKITVFNDSIEITFTFLIDNYLDSKKCNNNNYKLIENAISISRNN